LNNLRRISFFPLLFFLVSRIFSEQSLKELKDTHERIYKMKAVFIYNFTRYVVWPEESLGDTFKIAVLGNSSIIAPLHIIAKKRNVRGKKIEIFQYTNTDAIKPSNILFIDSTFDVDITDIESKERQTSSLIVGDKRGLSETGMGISFFIQDGKVKFELNRKAIERAGLSVSSQLLKLAKIVE